MKATPSLKIVLRSFLALSLATSSLLFIGCAGNGTVGAPSAQAGADVAPSTKVSNSRRIANPSAENAYAPKPAPRPGLGTDWGREVKASMNYTTFTRASSSPYGKVETIYYNDAEGIRAMTNRSSYKTSGLQKSANGLVEWGVKQGWGSVKNFHANGKRYISGKNGKTYSLIVKNRCHSRLEIVLSVDGLDVMDGKFASVKKRGYIVNSGETLEVKGFRTAEDAVASFRFSTVSNSYSSERHGTTRNVGVIGMAVFTEKGRDPWKWSTRERQNRASASPFAQAAR